MKVTLQEHQNEIAKYYCDKHSDRECYSELKISSWYGSKFDMNENTIHLCDECVSNIYELIKKEFKAELIYE
jgi:hypothetical protein